MAQHLWRHMHARPPHATPRHATPRRAAPRRAAPCHATPCHDMQSREGTDCHQVSDNEAHWLLPSHYVRIYCPRSPNRQARVPPLRASAGVSTWAAMASLIATRPSGAKVAKRESPMLTNRQDCMLTDRQHSRGRPASSRRRTTAHGEGAPSAAGTAPAPHASAYALCARLRACACVRTRCARMCMRMFAWACLRVRLHGHLSSCAIPHRIGTSSAARELTPARPGRWSAARLAPHPHPTPRSARRRCTTSRTRIARRWCGSFACVLVHWR